MKGSVVESFRSKGKKTLFALGTFAIAFTLGTMLVLPLFQDKRDMSQIIGNTETVLEIGDVLPYGQNINGSQVEWENEYARLEVYPHTSNELCRHTQYANLTWKYPDNNIDIAFRFNFSLTGQKDIWLWQNISHDVRVPIYDYTTYNYTLFDITSFQSISEPESVDFGDIPSDNYYIGDASFYDEDSGEIITDTFTIGFDSFEWNNPEHDNATFYYEEYGVVGY